MSRQTSKSSFPFPGNSAFRRRCSSVPARMIQSWYRWYAVKTKLNVQKEEFHSLSNCLKSHFSFSNSASHESMGSRGTGFMNDMVFFSSLTFFWRQFCRVTWACRPLRQKTYFSKPKTTRIQNSAAKNATAYGIGRTTSPLLHVGREQAATPKRQLSGLDSDRRLSAKSTRST